MCLIIIITSPYFHFSLSFITHFFCILSALTFKCSSFARWCLCMSQMWISTYIVTPFAERCAFPREFLQQVYLRSVLIGRAWVSQTINRKKMTPAEISLPGGQRRFLSANLWGLLIRLLCVKVQPCCGFFFLPIINVRLMFVEMVNPDHTTWAVFILFSLPMWGSQSCLCCKIYGCSQWLGWSILANSLSKYTLSVFSCFIFVFFFETIRFFLDNCTMFLRLNKSNTVQYILFGSLNPDTRLGGGSFAVATMCKHGGNMPLFGHIPSCLTSGDYGTSSILRYVFLQDKRHVPNVISCLTFGNNSLLTLWLSLPCEQSANLLVCSLPRYGTSAGRQPLLSP